MFQKVICLVIPTAGDLDPLFNTKYLTTSHTYFSMLVLQHQVTVYYCEFFSARHTFLSVVLAIFWTGKS